MIYKNLQVERSRIKTLLLILGALGFIAAGIWIINDPDNNVVNKIMGGIAIIFFGSAIPILLKKFVTNENAIELNHYNLVIEPDSAKKLVLPWNKILGFEEISISGTKIITILVSNLQGWINDESNVIKRKLMQFNYNSYNTPFNITSAGANISHKKLLKALNEFHSQYK